MGIPLVSVLLLIGNVTAHLRDRAVRLVEAPREEGA